MPTTTRRCGLTDALLAPSLEDCYNRTPGEHAAPLRTRQDLVRDVRCLRLEANAVTEGRLETLSERSILTVTGTRWRVREAAVHGVPGAEAATCLIFDGGTVCRRLWRYPARWRELADAALLAIMERPRAT